MGGRKWRVRAYCLVGAGWFLGASLGGDLVAILYSDLLVDQNV